MISRTMSDSIRDSGVNSFCLSKGMTTSKQIRAYCIHTLTVCYFSFICMTLLTKLTMQAINRTGFAYNVESILVLLALFNVNCIFRLALVGCSFSMCTYTMYLTLVLSCSQFICTQFKNSF